MRLFINYIYRSITTIKLIFFRNNVPFSSRIDSSAKIYDSNIGKWCYIGPFCIMNRCVLGNYVSIGPGCNIGGMEHSYWYKSTSTFLSDKCISDQETIIGNDVWIAAGVTIKQGVKIGNGAVIGANSFVTKDVPDYSITFGTPAIHHKYRFADRDILSLMSSHYWNYSPNEARKILDGISI